MTLQEIYDLLSQYDIDKPWYNSIRENADIRRLKQWVFQLAQAKKKQPQDVELLSGDLYALLDLVMMRDVYDGVKGKVFSTLEEKITMALRPKASTSLSVVATESALAVAPKESLVLDDVNRLIATYYQTRSWGQWFKDGFSWFTGGAPAYVHRLRKLAERIAVRPNPVLNELEAHQFAHITTLYFAHQGVDFTLEQQARIHANTRENVELITAGSNLSTAEFCNASAAKVLVAQESSVDKAGNVEPLGYTYVKIANRMTRLKVLLGSEILQRALANSKSDLLLDTLDAFISPHTPNEYGLADNILSAAVNPAGLTELNKRKEKLRVVPRNLLHVLFTSELGYMATLGPLLDTLAKHQELNFTSVDAVLPTQSKERKNYTVLNDVFTSLAKFGLILGDECITRYAAYSNEDLVKIKTALTKLEKNKLLAPDHALILDNLSKAFAPPDFILQVATMLETVPESSTLTDREADGIALRRFYKELLAASKANSKLDCGARLQQLQESLLAAHQAKISLSKVVDIATASYAIGYEPAQVKEIAQLLVELHPVLALNNPDLLQIILQKFENNKLNKYSAKLPEERQAFLAELRTFKNSLLSAHQAGVLDADLIAVLKDKTYYIEAWVTVLSLMKKHNLLEVMRESAGSKPGEIRKESYKKLVFDNFHAIGWSAARGEITELSKALTLLDQHNLLNSQTMLWLLQNTKAVLPLAQVLVNIHTNNPNLSKLAEEKDYTFVDYGASVLSAVNAGIQHLIEKQAFNQFNLQTFLHRLGVQPTLAKAQLISLLYSGELGLLAGNRNELELASYHAEIYSVCSVLRAANCCDINMVKKVFTTFAMLGVQDATRLQRAFERMQNFGTEANVSDAMVKLIFRDFCAKPKEAEDVSIAACALAKANLFNSDRYLQINTNANLASAVYYMGRCSLLTEPSYDQFQRLPVDESKCIASLLAELAWKDNLKFDQALFDTMLKYPRNAFTVATVLTKHRFQDGFVKENVQAVIIKAIENPTQAEKLLFPPLPQKRYGYN